MTVVSTQSGPFPQLALIVMRWKSGTGILSSVVNAAPVGISAGVFHTVVPSLDCTDRLGSTWPILFSST
eukprot:2017025-Ditylum_brightwellii.AAC.1